MYAVLLLALALVAIGIVGQILGRHAARPAADLRKTELRVLRLVEKSRRQRNESRLDHRAELAPPRRTAETGSVGLREAGAGVGDPIEPEDLNFV